MTPKFTSLGYFNSQMSILLGYIEFPQPCLINLKFKVKLSFIARNQFGNQNLHGDFEFCNTTVPSCSFFLPSSSSSSSSSPLFFSLPPLFPLSSFSLLYLFYLSSISLLSLFYLSSISLLSLFYLSSISNLLRTVQ